MKHRCLTLLLVLFAAAPVGAQVSERPVAFDSVGRVPTITPSLAERLRLGPPLWPVLGSFASAQLFMKSTGGYTLVVTRPDGTFDRYDLSGESAEALRGVIETALASGQRAGIGEQTSVASDPAGNAFVRNQALLGLFLYGPAAATMVSGNSGDGSGALAAELIVASGTFAAALARRNASPPITTAQNRLSTHAALHGAALGEALLYAVRGGDGESDGGPGAGEHGAALLVGSVGGTLLGLRAARTMTDAEAAASGFGATFTAGVTAGVIGMAGGFNQESSRRAAVGGVAAGMIGGYMWGPSYPRRAPYTVTDGDVRAMTLGTLIGVAAAAIPFIDNNTDGQVIAGALTAGGLVGAFAGDRWLVRPRDHTTSEATLLWTGAGVGAFVGGGVASLGNATAQGGFGLAVAGAILGAAATEAAVHPRPGGRRILSSRAGGIGVVGTDAESAGIAREINPRRTQITFDPVGAVFAATSRRGTFSVLRVSF